MNLLVLANSIIYAFLGIFILIAGFIVVDRLTPYDLWKELIEHKNLALAVVVGCIALGISVIIAAAIH